MFQGEAPLSYRQLSSSQCGHQFLDSIPLNVLKKDSLAAATNGHDIFFNLSFPRLSSVQNHYNDASPTPSSLPPCLSTL